MALTVASTNMTLLVDPDTHLIRRATLDMSEVLETVAKQAAIITGTEGPDVIKARGGADRDQLDAHGGGGLLRIDVPLRVPRVAAAIVRSRGRPHRPIASLISTMYQSAETERPGMKGGCTTTPAV